MCQYPDHVARMSDKRNPKQLCGELEVQLHELQNKLLHTIFIMVVLWDLMLPVCACYILS
uniref:Uncharacterized protein n=1 Tax=Arion vulgaris TaxID=1028688 RepID=A0A0B7BR71_9EUPU